MVKVWGERHQSLSLSLSLGVNLGLSMLLLTTDLSILHLTAAEDVLTRRPSILGHAKVGHDASTVECGSSIALLLVVKDLTIIQNQWEAEWAASVSTNDDVVSLDRVLVVAAVRVLLIDSAVVHRWVLAEGIEQHAANAEELITGVTGVVSMGWSLEVVSEGHVIPLSDAELTHLPFMSIKRARQTAPAAAKLGGIDTKR